MLRTNHRFQNEAAVVPPWFLKSTMLTPHSSRPPGYTHASELGLGSRYGENDHTTTIIIIIIIATITKPADVF